jgi:hypothetical protein
VKRRQMAVCDEEQEYTRRFAGYANRYRDPLFTVHGYTNIQELIEDTKEHPADIILLSGNLTKELGKEGQTGQIICLSEEEYQEEMPDYPMIYKYQSCQQILRKAYAIYAERTPAGLGTALRLRDMKRIGVFSPAGRTGKTSFALALGKELAKQRRTLYLNMEEFSGFEILYPWGDGWTLSELIYYMKQGKNAFACKLESMTGQIGGLDYIPPVKSPLELRSIGREDWEKLLEALEKESRYEYVILDLSCGVESLFELLEQCDGIYMPHASDETAQAKLWQYKEALKLLEMEDILEKTEKIVFSSAEQLEEYARMEGKKWREM